MHAHSRRVLVSCASASFLAAAGAHAAISPVGAAFFGAGSTTITFGEVPVNTPIPMTIGIASFTGTGGLTFSGGSGAPPAPSGDPYLFSGSSGNSDVIEVAFASPQSAAGAYFNTLGGGSLAGTLVLEFYNGASLLGSVDAVTSITSGFGGFVGGESDSANITRIIFRDIDDTNAVSFRIDDLVFIPAPGAGALAALGLLAASRRRRHG